VQGDEFDAIAIDNNQENLLFVNSVNYTNTLAGEKLNIGYTYVVWTANDGNNYTQCNYLIHVVDVEPPTVDYLEEVTRDTDPGDRYYTVQGDEFDPIITDNNPNPDHMYMNNDFNNRSSLAGEMMRFGTHEVNWTLSDGSNFVYCTTTIHIVNNELPTFIRDCNSIGNQVVEIDATETNYTHLGSDWDVTARDNVNHFPDLFWTLTGATEDNGIKTLNNVTFNVGVTNVKWHVEDKSGNFIECEYTVTLNVYTNEPPTIECVDNATRDTDKGKNYYTVVGNEFDATASDDNLETLVLTNDFNDSNTLAGAKLPIGTNNIIWTATDEEHTVECTTTITITDNEPPVFVTDCNSIGNQIVEIEKTEATYTHIGTNWDILATDNDEIANINWTLSGATEGEGTTTINGVTFNLGTTYVKWIVTDNSGNSIECSYNVTVNEVEDVEEPLEYCDSYANSSYYEWINRFIMANVDNYSYGNRYSDFTNKVINVKKGDIVPVYYSSGKRGDYSSVVCWSIWIDYNHDGIFSNNELVVNGWYYSGYMLQSRITIPQDALNGETRLRISMKYRNYAGPCEIFQHGEVEDYTINISDGEFADYAFIGENNLIDDTEYYHLIEGDVPSNDLYPNPTKDIITLNIFNLDDIIDINYKILDLSSKVVLSGKTTSNQIDVSTLKNGTYILYIDDIRPISIKFIKE
jgi:hypothetical protein